MSVLSHWNFGLNRSNTISLKCYCTVVREKPESQPEGHWLLCGTFIHELVVDCRLVWMSPGEARLQRLELEATDRDLISRAGTGPALRHPRLGIESVEWLQMNVKWGNKSFDITQQPFENFCAVFSVSIAVCWGFYFSFKREDNWPQ